MNMPMPMNYDYLILAHLGVNALVFGICICRLGKMHNALVRVKAQYVILLVASAANGFSPVFFQQWPTYVSIFYASAVLYVLWSDSYQWRGGTPQAAISDHAPLDAPSTITPT